MTRRFLLPLLAWECIVIGWIVVIMLTYKKTLNTENIHKLEMAAGLGILVVPLCFLVCRLLPRTAASAAGLAVGLCVPPLCAWTWSFLLPFPWWTGPFEVKLMGLVLSIPSALGGAFVGFLQARAPREHVT